MHVDAPGSMDLFDTISVTFNEPVLDINKEMFFLDQKIDTVWNTVDFDFFPDSTNSLNYFIRRPWKYGEEYRIEVDSAAIHSLYGKWNTAISISISTVWTRPLSSNCSVVETPLSAKRK